LEFLKGIVGTPANFLAGPLLTDSRREEAPKAVGTPRDDLDAESAEQEESCISSSSSSPSDYEESQGAIQRGRQIIYTIGDESLYIADSLPTASSAVDLVNAPINPLVASPTPVVFSTSQAVAAPVPAMVPVTSSPKAATSTRPAASSPMRDTSEIGSSQRQRPLPVVTITMDVGPLQVQQAEVTEERSMAVACGTQLAVKDEKVSSVSLLDEKEIDLELAQRMDGWHWRVNRKIQGSRDDPQVFVEWLAPELCHKGSRRCHMDPCTFGHDKWDATTEVHIEDGIIEILSDRTEKCVQSFDSVTLLKVTDQPDPWSDESMWRSCSGNIIYKRIDSQYEQEDLFHSHIVIKEHLDEVPSQVSPNRLWHLVRLHCSREGEASALTIDHSYCDCSIFVGSNWQPCATTARSTDGTTSFLFGTFIQNCIETQTSIAWSSDGTELRDAPQDSIQALYTQYLYAEVFRQSASVTTYTDSSAGLLIATRCDVGHGGHLEVRELFVQQPKAIGRTAMCQTKGTENEADTGTKVSIERAMEKIHRAFHIGPLYLVRRWLGT